MVGHGGGGVEIPYDLFLSNLLKTQLNINIIKTNNVNYMSARINLFRYRLN